ncbi:TPA: hypothetical protein ACH3X1_007034 [Trebouxia sp. C0004]
MVLLHIKKTEDEQFLCEIPVATKVTDATRELVDLQNLRTRIHRLKLEGEELAKYGPAKPLDQQGIDKYAEPGVQKGANYQQDPTGRRTGQGPDPAAAKTLLKTLVDAERLAHKDQVANKVLLTRGALEAAIDHIRGAVMIAFPQGLPEWDLVRQALEGTEELAGTSHANDELDPATATLWFAGKQLLPKNQLSHHLGRHEKTKAVIKLQQAGQGAPSREAVGYLPLCCCACCLLFHNAAVHLACCAQQSCPSDIEYDVMTKQGSGVQLHFDSLQLTRRCV